VQVGQCFESLLGGYNHHRNRNRGISTSEVNKCYCSVETKERFIELFPEPDLCKAFSWKDFRLVSGAFKYRRHNAEAAREIFHINGIEKRKAF